MAKCILIKIRGMCPLMRDVGDDKPIIKMEDTAVIYTEEEIRDLEEEVKTNARVLLGINLDTGEIVDPWEKPEEWYSKKGE